MHTSHQAKHPTLHLRRALALALAVAGATLALGLLNPLAASAQAPSAKYRVSVIGFDVTNGTWDDALQYDGKCDEVYVTANVNVLKKSTGAAFTTDPRSATYGDGNGYPGRTVAGSCTGWFQPTGGLQHDDKVNMDMTLFEGTLVQGDDAITITPSIFEWDKEGGSFVQDFADWAAKTLESQRSRLNTLLGPEASPYLDWTQVGLDVIARTREITGTSGTRPIGMKKDGDAFAFKPDSRLVTYDTAALMAETTSAYGKGVIAIPFDDDPSLKGSYTLKVKVTRLDPPPAPTPTPTPTEPVEEPPLESPLCRRKPWLCM